MENNFQSNHAVAVIAIIVGVIGIVAAVAAFAFVFSPPDSKTTSTPMQPTSSPSSGYEPEIIPPPTHTPAPTQTATVVPTSTPFPTRTPFVLPTIVSSSQLLLLPDLIVTGLSHPICVPDRPGTILEFTFYVRNIGDASTRHFGSFDVDVFLLLGQRRYGLDEWATQFNGVIGASKMTISNLDPGQDIKFTVVIDLKGNRKFGIEVIANAGDDHMREADMSNNTLTKYFSAACYSSSTEIAIRISD